MQIFLHSIFYGNPGTGKSTVCRLYGSLLKETGLLSKGHVVVADRKVFTGDCFGDTEDILRELIKYSEGGILLFDEAYLLEGTHPNDPNKMVLPMLLSELADNSKKDFAVVLSGYKDKLDRMLEQNPGLYPIRGRATYLHVRKRKWLDKDTGEIFSYEWELSEYDETHLNAEFVAFLKEGD